MNPLLYQWIDRMAIQFAAARMPVPDGRDLHLKEAALLLKNPDLFSSATNPITLEFDGPVNFRFATPRPTAHAVNNVVHGRFYRCGDDWRQKPVVLMLHGWSDVLNHRWFFPRYARRLNQLGLSAATLQLPWHFDRRPRELGAWGNFLSADILRTVESVVQAMADIRAFVDWLLSQEIPHVGLWGVSMGGWLAGLTICEDARIGSAILTVPVARLDRLIDSAPFCGAIRDVLRDRPVDLGKLNLVSRRPVIAREKILLVEAEYDLFIDKADIEELWHSWNEPEIWRFPHGHISVLGAPGFAQPAVRWMAARAAK